MAITARLSAVGGIAFLALAVPACLSAEQIRNECLERPRSPGTPVKPARMEATAPSANGRAALCDDIVPGEMPASERGWYDWKDVPDQERTLGRIEIQRIGISAPILVGVDDWSMRRGVGFFPDTARPDDRDGNTALASHRGTDFWGLRNIQQGDEVVLKTAGGDVFYVVEKTFVVDPKEVWVLDRSTERELTLITCYPFDFKGHAPQRFVVKARPKNPPA